MENNIIIKADDERVDRICGVYLKGMTLKEYMKDRIVPILDITLVCGERVVYWTLEDMPEGSVPCTCGNPKHWFVFIEK